jgi:signal peptidase II
MIHPYFLPGIFDKRSPRPWSFVLRLNWYNTPIICNFGGNLKKTINYAALFLVAGIIISLDQWTKSLVRTLPVGGTWLPAGLEWLAPYARIVHWYNSGAAFGSFQGYGWVFTILAFVVVSLIIYYYPQVDDRDWWLKLAMGMQMGGALGNVVDRLSRGDLKTFTVGPVTDFISVGTFAVFNVADASISVGVVVLLLGAWFKERSERKKAQAESVPVEPTLPQGEALGEGESPSE